MAAGLKSQLEVLGYTVGNQIDTNPRQLKESTFSQSTQLNSGCYCANSACFERVLCKFMENKAISWY